MNQKSNLMLKSVTIILTLLISRSLFGYAMVNDSTLASSKSTYLDNEAAVYRTFPGLSPIEPLLPFHPIPMEIADDSLLQERSRAHSLRDEVELAQRFRETLDAYSMIDLPMGVSRSGGLVDYAIIIDKIAFNPQGSILDAYMSFTIPLTGHRIAFGGKIPLSKDGGIVGTAKIYLLGDYPIPLNSKSTLILLGNDKTGTYVEIDCNGFKGMSIEGNIEFSRDFLLPEDEKGKTKSEPLLVNVRTYIRDWNEMMVKVNIPPFQVVGLKNVGFKVHEAFLDWSDLANPLGLGFPRGYESAYLTAGNVNLWRGFFLRSAEVRLPPSLKEGRDSVRVKVGVENMVIDDTGFSGRMFAENLISEGDMSGWPFSLDRMSVGVISNQVETFELAGKVTVPVFKIKGEAARMGYRAVRDANDNYIFTVAVIDTVDLPMWVAKVSLYKGTSVTVRERDNRFYPTAVLNGMLSVKTQNAGPKIMASGIRFEQMVLSTEAPYFKPGVFGVGTAPEGSKASGFPLVIRNIGIKSDNVDHKIGLSFDVTINIGGNPEEEGFSGTAGLIVWGDMGAPPQSTSGEAQAAPSNEKGWEFDKVEVTAVGISIKKPGAYELDGLIRFFDNDNVYGDGFNGLVRGVFHKVIVQANVIFGRTPTYRYWFADALAVINGGVALAPGFAAYSFSGGFYSKMKQSVNGPRSPLGQTASGITYMPDENSMGLRAFVEFGTQPTKNALNGDVTFRIEMNKHGGINRVSLNGNAYLLTPTFSVSTEVTKRMGMQMAENVNAFVDKLLPKSQVYGSVKLLFDNENDVFHGDIEVYVNTLGGVVKGIGANNRAGWAVLHFASDEWYVLIGTPDQPVGLEVARLFKSKSYFMMGKNLPGSPPPPRQVSEILGGQDLDYMRDLNALSSGFGFAFGMNFGVDTGDIRFLIFYGRFSAGAGMDIMLKNYGTAYTCEGSGDPVGINGWYANGQAYAFVEGKIGIKVNLLFHKGEFDILAIGAAAVFQAKGPSPFWMQGTVGGYYRILGGLVKGRVRFEVTVGKECKPVGEGNPLQNVNMIADISPASGSQDVDVFNAPQVVFNIPVGEVFEIEEPGKPGKRLFRARLAEFSLKEGNTQLNGNLQWNSTKDVVVLNAHDILPPQKSIKALARLVFEERAGADWLPVKFDGKAVEEMVETTFTTGTAPDYIPVSNVEVSYPIAGQYNFYPAEYGNGFIQLKRGQPYLFENDPKWIKKARMTEQGNTQRYKEFDFAYDAGAKRVNYAIPGDLTLATIYRFELLNIPKQSQVIDANVERVSQELVAGEAGVAELTTKEAEGQVELLEVKGIYDVELRTSKYGKFLDKASSINVLFTTREYVDPVLNKFRLVGRLGGEEFFDKIEIQNINQNNGLIEIEADIENNDWYRNRVYPLVYEGYPLQEKFTIKHRGAQEMGVPPNREVSISQNSNDLFVENGSPSPTAAYAFSYALIVYNLMNTMVDDYKDIQHQIASYAADRSDLLTPRLAMFLTDPFPVIPKGVYKVKLTYVIPGIKQKTSNYQWKLEY